MAKSVGQLSVVPPGLLDESSLLLAILGNFRSNLYIIIATSSTAQGPSIYDILSLCGHRQEIDGS